MTLDNTEDTSATETEETPAAEVPAEGAETPETPEEPAAEEGAEAAAEEEAEEEEAKPDGKKRARAGGFQRKIERLEREKELLYQQLMQGGQRPVAPQPQGQEETPEQRAAAYIQNLVDQGIAQREAQARQAAAQADFQRRTQEVRALHPDFEEVVMGAEHIPVPPALQQAILTSPVGPEIMYQLAANPAELARISALPPFDVAREIGRLEAKSSVSAPSKAPPKVAPRKPAAPAPIAPVTARGPTTVKPVKDMTYEEYNAWRDSQRKR